MISLFLKALFFCQEMDKANQMLEKAIELDQNDTVAYFHAGQAASQQQQHQRALECYDKVENIYIYMLCTTDICA